MSKPWKTRLKRTLAFWFDLGTLYGVFVLLCLVASWVSPWDLEELRTADLFGLLLIARWYRSYRIADQYQKVAAHLTASLLKVRAENAVLKATRLRVHR